MIALTLELVIVEMQVLNIKGFEQRILYNAAKSYSRQLREGEDYTLLNPVIALTLTDFTLFEADTVCSRFLLLEKERFIQYRDDIELIFFELPKFTKTDNQLATIQDKWLYFIKNAGRLNIVPKALDEAPILEAFAIANTAAMTSEDLEQQEQRHDFIRLQRGAQAKAFEDGQAVGENAKALAVARNLLPLLDDEAIANVTGLSLEAVARLHKRKVIDE